METIVISIGGSVLLSEEADVKYLKKLGELLNKISSKNKLFIIVGGGSTARKYIKKGRELSFTEEVLDQIGIDITKVNAKMLANIVKTSNIEIPETTDDAKEINKPIVIMGGTTPGHSTDMVGAELAEKTKADRYIIATNVDGIYNKDPNKHKDAIKFEDISIDELIGTFGTSWEKAGKNMVIDGPALQIIKQIKIPVFVVNGKNLIEFEKCINNLSFDGTRIEIEKK